jgi:hypothetical protein
MQLWDGSQSSSAEGSIALESDTLHHTAYPSEREKKGPGRKIGCLLSEFLARSKVEGDLGISI